MTGIELVGAVSTGLLGTLTVDGVLAELLDAQDTMVLKTPQHSSQNKLRRS